MATKKNSRSNSRRSNNSLLKSNETLFEYVLRNNFHKFPPVLGDHVLARDNNFYGTFKGTITIAHDKRPIYNTTGPGAYIENHIHRWLAISPKNYVKLLQLQEEQEPVVDLKIPIGYIGVVIYVGYGSFNLNSETETIPDNTVRHDERYLLAYDSLSRKNKKEYSIICIPDYMVNYYSIEQYELGEGLILKVLDYKFDKIREMRYSGLSEHKQLIEIDKILDKNISKLEL